MKLGSVQKFFIAACVFCATKSSLYAHPKLAIRAVSTYLGSQGMIYIPTSWEPLIQPGSLIVVQWHRKLGVWRLDGSLPYMVAEDRPVAPVSGKIASGLSQAFQNRSIDVNAVLGGLSPSLALSQATTVDYPQTEFENQTFDAVGLKNLIAKSAITRDSLHDITAQENGATLFRYGYQAFIVTQVFAASNIDIKTTSNTALTLRTTSTTDAAVCSTTTDSTVDKSKVQADATTGTLKTPDKLQSASAKTLPVPPVTLTLCNKGGGVYKLSRTPAVPLGMTVAAIGFDGNTPRIVPTNGNDLRQAINGLFVK